MYNNIRSRIIEEVSRSIDIPDSAYKKAEARYKDLSEWFGRKDARCHAFDPHIYSQGSFRLGTVICPVNDHEEYDLDMGCRLRTGITKVTHTQQQLKERVGADIEDYRVARGIKEKREEKHRCWRLKYADTLKFHMDTVPSIPETSARRQLIQEALNRAGTQAELSMRVASLAGAITDDRLSNYRSISDAWRRSNSEGFALWFESRMRQAKPLMENLALQAKAARVDELPAYRWKTPLQRCVQLLKRHRDMCFANDPDGKPASVIITTLSARAYRGEIEIADALDRILSTMESLINPSLPRVPNPVDPSEDFADRWSDPASKKHNLEVKFRLWIQQARKDFDAIGNERKPERIIESVKDKLGASLNASGLNAVLGISPAHGLLQAAAVPAGLSFPNKPLVPQKPAGFA